MPWRLVQIWVHVPTHRTDKKTGEKISTLHVIIEKKSMVNLVCVFSRSVLKQGCSQESFFFVGTSLLGIREGILFLHSIKRKI